MPSNSHVNPRDFVSIPSISSDVEDKGKPKKPILDDCKEQESEMPFLMAPSAVTDKSNSIAALAGKYAQEPLWSEFLKSIEEYNQEVNLREGKAE